MNRILKLQRLGVSNYNAVKGSSCSSSASSCCNGSN